VLYRCTGNRLLIKLLDIFRVVYQNLHHQSLGVTRNIEAEVQTHQAILQAIEAKDIPLAQQRMQAHFDGIKDRLKAVRLINKDEDEES
jgi:DNA-binding FadR family transcriptional regulator